MTKRSIYIFLFFIALALALLRARPVLADGQSDSSSLPRISGGSKSLIEFTITNEQDGAINLIRLEAPPGFIINAQPECPEDRDTRDDYTWTSDMGDGFATCQTSPNAKNKDLIQPRQTIVIRVLATAPNPDQDTVYDWSIITEHKPDFERRRSGYSVLVDINPPKVTSAVLEDSDGDGQADLMHISFDEEVLADSLKASAFQVGGQHVKTIVAREANSYDLLIDESVSDDTGLRDLFYDQAGGPVIDRFGHTLVSIGKDDLIEGEKIKPRVVSSLLDGGSLVLSSDPRRLDVYFSEEMDESYPPRVELVGSDVQVIKALSFSGRHWQGLIKLPPGKNEEMVLRVADFRDKAGNIATGAIELGTYEARTELPPPAPVLDNGHGAGTSAETGGGITTGGGAIGAGGVMNSGVGSFGGGGGGGGGGGFGGGSTSSAAKADPEPASTQADPGSSDKGPTSTNSSDRIDKAVSGPTDNVILATPNDILNLIANESAAIAGVPISSQKENFVKNGTESTKRLGAGERAGILGSYKSAFGREPETVADWSDLLKIGSGRWPGRESAAAKAKAVSAFKKIYQRAPNLKTAADNNAIAVMSYGLRPLNRNLNSEQKALLTFKKIFKTNRLSSNDWDIVRAIAYSGAKR